MFAFERSKACRTGPVQADRSELQTLKTSGRNFPLNFGIRRRFNNLETNFRFLLSLR